VNRFAGRGALASETRFRCRRLAPVGLPRRPGL
jgi:hypothetical protein